MNYTDLRDFMPEYTYTDPDTGECVEIEKMGGGTVGNMYSGELWRYRVLDTSGGVVVKGQDLYIGHTATHHYAALVVLGMLEGES